MEQEVCAKPDSGSERGRLKCYAVSVAELSGAFDDEVQFDDEANSWDTVESHYPRRRTKSIPPINSSAVLRLSVSPEAPIACARAHCPGGEEWSPRSQRCVGRLCPRARSPEEQPGPRYPSSRVESARRKFMRGTKIFNFVWNLETPISGSSGWVATPINRLRFFNFDIGRGVRIHSHQHVFAIWQGRYACSERSRFGVSGIAIAIAVTSAASSESGFSKRRPPSELIEYSRKENTRNVIINRFAAWKSLCSAFITVIIRLHCHWISFSHAHREWILRRSLEASKRL